MIDCRAKRIKSRKEDKLERNENHKNAVELVQGKQEIISIVFFRSFKQYRVITSWHFY